MLFANLLERVLGENTPITPRRAARFEEGDAVFEEAPPGREFAVSAPRAAVESEAPAPLRAAAPVVSPPEIRLADRLIVPPAPAEPPKVQTVSRPQTRIAAREVGATPAAAPDRESRPAPPAVEQPPAETRREIRTEVQHQREIERFREIHTERLTLEKRLETLRVETRQDRVITESRTTGERQPAPVAPATRQSFERPAIRPSSVIREVRSEAAPRASKEARLPAPAPAASAVNVTIGRVEIRAVSPPVQRGGASSRGPKQSLAEYLRQREGA